MVACFSRSSLAAAFLSIFRSSVSTVTATTASSSVTAATTAAFVASSRRSIVNTVPNRLTPTTRRGVLVSTTKTTTGIIFASFFSAFAGTSVTTSQTLTAADSSTRTRTTTTLTMSSPNEMDTGYLNAKDAAALDAELMSSPGFSLEQLMELAGLSVAEAVYTITQDKEKSSSSSASKGVLVVCGPGNNGGDGLVAARHLVLFGIPNVVVVYPKKSSKQHFINLVQQCQDVGIPILDEMPQSKKDLEASYDIIVDAIFGFSFKGEPREPFAGILTTIKDLQEMTVISVDVPSGWNVDEGDVANTGFMPDVLISLTTPKHSAKNFQGRHFVGGRFLPPKLAEKYGVKMPPYPGVSQVMEVTMPSSCSSSNL